MTVQVTVGLDGSPESLAAAVWAAREAVRREVPLHMVHVEEWPVAPAIPYPIAAYDAQRSTGLLRDTAEQLRADHPGLEVTTEQARGRARSLLRAAADESDLMVLGSRGLGGFVGFLAGSVSLAVVRGSHQPVVLVRADGADAPAAPATLGPGAGEIVVGADLRHPDTSVLAFAFLEAARRGARVRVVHGWTPPGPSVYAMVADPGIGESAGGRVASALAELVEPLRRSYPDVHVVEDAVIGAAAVQLLEASVGAELVVVGRRSFPAPRGPHIGHIGHVAHAVIHHCAAPVAVVPFG
ncbi:universal stress protein [Streptomyces sp. NRRL F-4474]|uniref:universal stress protein n=1 Tax=Streptomyces sp. NRRL F-4474 TaxID=1463851 RepID=UPI0004CAB9D5|nr:universal stress protein [Streptomyces sp. NRRL F-4474]